MENTVSNNHKYMEDKTHKKYDLEDRTLRFARNVKDFVDQSPKKVTSD